MYFSNNELEQCYNFAWDMRGNHNRNMIMNRDDWEIFRDDFRGKLGEIAVRNYIVNNIVNSEITTDLDFKVTPKGQWDITDLVVNGKYINVKSIKQGSAFLLVETKRYDENGNYVYKNNDGNSVPIDYYVLVRVTVDPDVSKNVFSRKNFENFMNNAWNVDMKKEVIRTVKAEVLGGISHDEFWRRKKLANKEIKCIKDNLRAIANGKTLVDNERGTMPKNRFLQQDNYIISGETQLRKLEDIL